MRPTIYIASDHAGFSLKNELLSYVRETLGYPVIDCGAFTYEPEDDYTTYIAKAAKAVSDEPRSCRAIVIGGSGQGEAMLANRYSNVRAAVYYGNREEIIQLSRRHNDANVLSLGARFLSVEEAQDAVALWLATEHVPVEKYDRRIEEAERLTQIEEREPITSTLVRTIVPSIPAQTFAEIESLVHALSGAISGIQVDITDGVFVPHLSWPFNELDVEDALDQLALLPRKVEVEIDCMCMHPETYLPHFLRIGIPRVTVHVNSTEAYMKISEHAHTHGYKAGLAIKNDTPLEVFSRLLPLFDFVQVMGITNIGMQGQPFDPRTLETVSHIRNLYPQLEIAVDGGVNETTIVPLLRAGANRFAPGSAIAKAKDKKAAYEQLASMIMA